MPLDWLRPGFLWGLLAVALPVLIHLLGRRRPRVVPIATLRFLERARVRTASRWRLRRLLLLASRAAALACLALLFAGPGCRGGGGAAGPRTWVLLLDTSPSMAAARGGSSSLDRGREALRELVRAAGPSDRFLFATTCTGAEKAWLEGFSFDASAVLAAITEAGVEYGEHRSDRALERAVRLVDGTPGGGVAFATDLQASTWSGEEAPPAARAAVSILDVGIPSPTNGWVRAVSAEGATVRVELDSAPEARGTRRTVRLALEDGQNATAFVTGREAGFRIKAPPGVYAGVASAEPGGDLALDDRRAFAAQGNAKANVLLVNGDPRGFEIRDELFFLRRALAAGGRLSELFSVRELRPPEVKPSDLEAAEVVVLANTGPLAEPTAGALRRRVEAGAGLLVTAGDHWNRAESFGSLAPLMPAPFRDVISLAGAGGAARGFEPVDPGSFAGPLEPFRDRAAGDLGRTRVWTYFALELAAGNASSVWMRLENGAPLLLERRVGKGRSLFLATTLDRDGADLCLQPAFIPLVERLLLASAGRLRPRVARAVPAGLPLSLPYEEAVVVEAPDGERTPWQPGAATYVPPEPGAYRVALPDGSLVDAFAAVVDPRESDLTRLAPAALAARLPAERTRGSGGGSGVQGRSDASGKAAAALLAALALEALLSSRLGPRGRAGSDLNEPWSERGA